jgi:trigger factor
VIDSEYQILPSIGNKLIENKLKKGDKVDIDLDISKSLKLNEEKLVTFVVEILNIEESVPFVVDKDFLDKNGLKNEDDLKNNLKNSFKSQYENGLKQIEKKQLMDVLEKEHSFDLPQGILEQEFNDIWQKLEQAKKDGALDEDDKKLNDDELKKRYQEISHRRVKLAILLQFIAKENKIVVDEKELSNGMMQYASQYPGQEKEIIEYFKKNPSSIETIRGPILEEKVIKHISSQCNLIKLKLVPDSNSVSFFVNACRD